jgi:predicted dehydrogenase
VTVAGVLGFGSAGRRHAGLLRARGCEVLVSDPDASRAAVAIDEGYVALAEHDLLERASAVVIASPNHLHALQLAAAVEAGNDVLVEKPLAVTPTSEVAATLHRARSGGRIVGVGCNMRFVPAIELAREYLNDGALGRVLRVSAEFGYDLRRWRKGRDWREAYSSRPEHGGGILLDAIHEFDYLYWLFGDVSRVACFGGPRSSLELDVEDVVGVLLDFASGVIGSIALDYASGVYRRGLQIVGEEASLSWRWGQHAALLEHDGAVTELPVSGVEAMYERLIDDFLDALAERRAPRTPGEEGLAVLRIVDAARRFAFGAAGEAVGV